MLHVLHNDRTHSSTACNQETGPGTFICHQPVLIHIIHGRIHHGMPQKLLKTDKFVGGLNSQYSYNTRLKFYIYMGTCINCWFCKKKNCKNYDTWYLKIWKFQIFFFYFPFFLKIFCYKNKRDENLANHCPKICSSMYIQLWHWFSCPQNKDFDELYGRRFCTD